MKKISALMLSSLLLCGSAFAQTYEKLPPGYPPKSNMPNAERGVYEPVVEAAGRTWVVLAWSTKMGSSAIVRYGTERDHLTQTISDVAKDTSAGEIRRVKIDHLQPGTTYYYVVDFGPDEGRRLESKGNIEQFITKE